jgi:hypothetical protein
MKHDKREQKINTCETKQYRKKYSEEQADEK